VIGAGVFCQKNFPAEKIADDARLLVRASLLTAVPIGRRL
jgi:hypothetical protein